MIGRGTARTDRLSDVDGIQGSCPYLWICTWLSFFWDLTGSLRSIYIRLKLSNSLRSPCCRKAYPPLEIDFLCPSDGHTSIIRIHLRVPPWKSIIFPVVKIKDDFAPMKTGASHADKPEEKTLKVHHIALSSPATRYPIHTLNQPTLHPSLTTSHSNHQSWHYTYAISLSFPLHWRPSRVSSCIKSHGFFMRQGTKNLYLGESFLVAASSIHEHSHCTCIYGYLAQW